MQRGSNYIELIASDKASLYIASSSYFVRRAGMKSILRELVKREGVLFVCRVRTQKLL